MYFATDYNYSNSSPTLSYDYDYATASGNDYQADDLAMREVRKFTKLYENASDICDKLDNWLSAIGLLGNSIAMVVLINSRSMRTPSFTYHKLLIAADLLFCINYVILKIVHFVASSRIGLWIPPKYLYSDKTAVLYTGILSRCLTSTCGYVVLYASIAVSIDRFIALIVARYYDKFNRASVARFNIVLFVTMSAIFHSWSTWFERSIETLTFNFTNYTSPTNYYYIAEIQNSDLKTWIKIKDSYNLAIRVAYPIVLTILSISVIYAYNVQQKRRRTLCTVNKRRVRRERCLFLLMIAVVVLTYIQVLPREGKRLLDFLYPVSELKKLLKNQSIPLPQRLHYFYILSYGHEFWRLVQNTCTVVDRSLPFYLYFVLNYSFRRETLKLFRLNRLRLFFRFRRSGQGSNNSNRSTFKNGSSRHTGMTPLLRNGAFNFPSMEYSGMTSAI